MIGFGANAFVVPGTYGGGVSMAAGKASGVFGGFGAGLNTYNIAPVGAPDEFVSAARMSVNAGYDISVSKSQRISLCPIVSVAHRFGPNYTIGSANLRESANDYTAELAIGGAVAVGRKVDFVPTVSVGYSAVNWKLTQVGAGELTSSDERSRNARRSALKNATPTSGSNAGAPNAGVADDCVINDCVADDCVAAPLASLVRSSNSVAFQLR